MTYRELSFMSGGTTCSARHFAADGGDGRPVVVMGHGIGGTMDSGLAPFAERFAAAGLDVLTFDYRGFGHSGGEPRQTVSIDAQVDDYRAAIALAKTLPQIDPGQVVLWGASLSGGHVIRVGAGGDDVAAVISLTPMADPVATAVSVGKQYRPAVLARSAASGVLSRAAGALGRDTLMMPLVARPGQPGALTLEGAYENYLALAGPSWRNEIDSAVGMELAKIRVRRHAKQLRIPLLVQIADFDSYVPADAAQKIAVAGRAQVHHYPCDHFDVWPGHAWFERAADDQIAFLQRAL
ncbi:alpha/beta hydrolase [Mycolicibacterium chitae]|nr:alpha/beta fold hydrolase [Mycolicibacterium chitae]MCV7107086.1 alpha/beta fold hydrolase [Mycolicibacterium chitae]